MFRTLDQGSQGSEGGGHAASLSRAQILRSAAPAVPSAISSVPQKSAGRLARFEAWCERELTHDLAENIGTGRWYRGLATMALLAASAFALCPGFSAVEAAPALRADDAVRGQFLSQTIAPLALGGDMGRRMGASPLVTPLASVPERPSIQMVSTLTQGDSFSGMLERVGLGGADISRVNALVSQAVATGDIPAGTQFDITLGRHLAPGAPRALDAMTFRARFDLDLAIERHGDALSLVRHPIRVDATPLRIEGTVGSSLYRSARNAGAPISAIQDYLRAIDKQVSLDDLSAGDHFDMILAYKRSAEGDHQAGDLLYAGLVHDGRPRVQLMRWGKAGDMMPAPDVVQPMTSGLALPVSGRITSPYGPRRHPILGFVRMHAGMDIAAPYGSPIHAVRDGVVNFAGRHGGHGNFVRLDNGGGVGTGYAHMSRIAVAVGQRVRAGQVIGYVGSTGLSTGPHVHFEVYQNGHTVNPLSMRFVSTPSVDPKERDAYKAALARLLGIEPGAALQDMTPQAQPQTAPTREIDRLGAAQVK
ncbi:M23 family metallopeptidase [Novosphingobium sp. 9]|uniref:M23 family metallopeptidase n=1 Tax=Novosphingobium sp. 9 TaxID=2025349 RepID=UPI0021B64A5F|nr:M23 family metallopeptidase [Novosphingobium sp. 9]